MSLFRVTQHTFSRFLTRAKVDGLFHPRIVSRFNNLLRAGFCLRKTGLKQKAAPGREGGGLATQGGFWAAHHELKTLKFGRVPRHPPTGPKPSESEAPQAERGGLVAHPIPSPEVPVCRDLTYFVF